MISIRDAILGVFLLLLAVAPAAAIAQGATGPIGQGMSATIQGSPLGSGEDEPGPARLLLPELYELARANNPRLQAAHATVAASRAREASAGLPPDPMIELGALNLSLPGLRADMAGSMAPSVQALQTIPFPGKLGLSSKLARQNTLAETAEAEEAWWLVRRRVALAFYELYTIDRTLAVLAEALGLLRDFETVAQSLYATGGGRQADVLRANVEVARLSAERTRLGAGREGAAARLNAILGRPAETEVPSPMLSPLPLELPSIDTLQDWAEESRPLLEELRVRVDQAETRRALVRKELWPDLTVGVQYGQSRGALGTERMGSAIVGFTLPAFAGRRQLRLREEATTLEEVSRAILREQRVEIAARIQELVASLEQNRVLIALYRHEVLPQASANVASALAAYRAGMVDFLTLIDAQMGHNVYERELHALVAEYGATIVELELTVGRELPVTGEVLAEVP